MPVGPAPSAPSAAPPGAGAAPGTPPTGASPATMPVANRGMQAAGGAEVGMIVRQIQEAALKLGAGSEIGRDLVKALNILAKHVPPGAASPGVENQAMRNTMQKQQQMAPMIAQLRAGGAGGGGAPAAAAA